MMNTHLPLVSVIIPVYNHERFVKAALDSVYNQTYPHLEIVVVDDGSEDRSAEIVQEHLSNSPFPTSFLQQSNQGTHIAIHRGVDSSRGSYLAILNSDDFYEEERVARMVSILERSRYRFAYSKVRHVDEEGNPLSAENPLLFYYWRSLQDLIKFPTPSFELLRHNFAVSSGNFVFTRELYREVGSFSEYITCHDWDYLLRIMLKEEPLYINDVLYAYRVHSQSTLQKSDDLRGKEIDEVISTYLKNMDLAENPLAPTPGNWGGYWVFFQNRYLDHFREYREAARCLEGRSQNVDHSTRVWTMVERLNGVMYWVFKFWRKVGIGIGGIEHHDKAHFQRGVVQLLTCLARVRGSF